ncbi:MAG: TolC family protein [Candidatus Omnitrophica bacterium]|nr:TolC family protein [Candidatus Omnitrophota bacterium]
MKILRYLYVVVGLTLILNISGFAEDLKNETLYLSLQECIQIALDNNLDIKIAKLDNWIAGTDETYAKAVYDMILSGKITYTYDEQENASTIAPSKELINEYRVGIEKKLPTGTTLSIDYKNIRNWTDSLYVTLNPYYESEISFTAKQSVLKNMLGIQDRSDVKLARMNIEISDLETYRKIEKAIADVEKKYWYLVFAKENLKIKRDLLKKAEVMLSINESHIASGFMEKKDILASQANVKQRQIDCLIAENDLEDAINSLKLVLNKNFDNPILSLDSFEIALKKPDLIQNLETAMSNRKDFLAKKKELEKKKLMLVMKKNAFLPELDLFATYYANGVDRKVEKSHGTLTTTKFPKYYVGAELKYPFENSKGKSEYKKAELGKIKAINELKQLEKNIINEIDENVREAGLNMQKIIRTSKIKELQDLKLKEEEIQYKNGRSSSKVMIDFQNDLLKARLDVVKAFLDYHYSLIDLEVSKDIFLDNKGIKIDENL